MLSPLEAEALYRGQRLKRYVRAAAALQGLYDDVAIADAVQVQRGAVAGWWRGAKPSPMTLRSLADATGLSVEELSAFTYYDGPPPHLPDPEDAEAEERADAAERSRHATPGDEGSEARPAPRESTGSGR